jgi:hypothetical protein
MSARREFSRKLRREIVERARNAAGLLVCEGCGLILGRKPYEIDHIIPEALIVNNAPPLTAADGQLLGVKCCHRGGGNKTAGDVQRIRKSDRQRDKDSGALKRAPRPMPGSRNSPFKKRMNGQTEWRGHRT